MEIVDGNGPGNGGQGPGNGGVPAGAIKDAEIIKCEKCESQAFTEAMQIRKISRFLTGSDRDSIAPLPVIACVACGHVNKDFEPQV